MPQYNHSGSEGGFTLIELMIVIAIVGILAAIAIPSYQEQVAVSSGGAAMKNITGYVLVGQVCVQTGNGCDDLNDSITSVPQLSEMTNGGSVSQGASAQLVFDNGRCVVIADITANGGLVYSAAASAGTFVVSDAQCQRGAGLL